MLRFPRGPGSKNHLVLKQLQDHGIQGLLQIHLLHSRHVPAIQQENHGENPGKMLENAMASRSLTCLFMGDINLHKPSKYGEAVGSYPNSIDCIMALWWQALWIHRPENMLRIPISDSQFVFNIFIVRQSENDTYFLNNWRKKIHVLNKNSYTWFFYSCSTHHGGIPVLGGPCYPMPSISPHSSRKNKQLTLPGPEFS